MDLGLNNKIAFVAASSDGLGKSVAMELAKEGAHVIICGRNAQKLEETKSVVEDLGTGDVLAITADLTNSGDVQRLIEKTLSQFGTIDILVTNTGGPPPGKFEELDEDDWHNAYHQLFLSASRLVQGFLPKMKQQPWGRIIAITSQAVKQPVQNLALSNAMRASVLGLMKTLSNELGEYNITVNNVMPGYTQTGRLERLIQAKPEFANAVGEIPLGRFGDPEEFAAAVTFLASARASYITGTSLAVDGGWIKNIL